MAGLGWFIRGGYGGYPGLDVRRRWGSVHAGAVEDHVWWTGGRPRSADERAAASPAGVSGTPGVSSVPTSSNRATIIARRSASMNITPPAG
jgi:hypothetical protein